MPRLSTNGRTLTSATASAHSSIANLAHRTRSSALRPTLRRRPFTCGARTTSTSFRIAWYLQRYHDIKVSSGTVYNVLLRHGLNRLPRNAKKRTVMWQRYEKQVPGHHVQVDVKFLDFNDQSDKKVRRFQYRKRRDRSFANRDGRLL